MNWRNTGGKAASVSQISNVGTLSAEGAEKLFAGSGHKLCRRAGGRRDARGRGEGFGLPGQLSVSSKTEFKNLESENIVGILPGSDPS